MTSEAFVERTGAITRHNKPRAILLTAEEFEALADAELEVGLDARITPEWGMPVIAPAMKG